MKKVKKVDEPPRGRPATSPEQREDELINLAVDLAEKQLRDGTASTQVIVHYLKLGSTRGMLEQEMLEHQTELVRAKTEAIQSNKKVEELYTNALEAMRIYSGSEVSEDEDFSDVR